MMVGKIIDKILDKWTILAASVLLVVGGTFNNLFIVGMALIIIGTEILRELL